MSRQEQGKNCYWIKRSLLASENLKISVKLSADWIFEHTFVCFSMYSDNSRAGEVGGNYADLEDFVGRQRNHIEPSLGLSSAYHSLVVICDDPNGIAHVFR